MKTVSELTKSFIVEYKNWNDFAYKLNNVDSEKSHYKIGKMYDDIILKYCGSEKKYQGLAYGSDSNHCPEQEQVLKELIETSKAIVFTKFVNKKFNFLSHNYEYHFTLVDHKWILDEVYLVDDNGKHKSL